MTIPQWRPIKEYDFKNGDCQIVWVVELQKALSAIPFYIEYEENGNTIKGVVKGSEHKWSMTDSDGDYYGLLISGTVTHWLDNLTGVDG